jgi:hypothetical protein
VWGVLGVRGGGGVGVWGCGCVGVGVWGCGGVGVWGCLWIRGFRDSGIREPESQNMN